MQKDRRGYWTAVWTINGDRDTRATGTKNKREAARLQAQFKAEAVAASKAAEGKRDRNKKGKIVDQTIDEAFLLYWEKVGQHAEGKADIKDDLKRIIGYLGKDFMVSDIDTEVLTDLRDRRMKEFKKWRTKDGKAPIDKKTGKPKEAKPISKRTVNINIHDRMRMVLKYLKGLGRDVQTIEWSMVIAKGHEARETEFGYAHEQLLLETYRRDHLPALSFALLAGPRRKQLLVRWSDIDWDKRTIKFIPLKQKPRADGTKPKPYILPLTTTMENLILSQIDPATGKPFHPEFVWTFIAERTYYNVKAKKQFVKDERYPLTYEGLGTQFARWKKSQANEFRERGLLECRLHDMRHAHGERLAEVCLDPMIVRDSLNHSDLSTTERYMGSTKLARMRAAMEAKEVHVRATIVENDAKTRNHSRKQADI